MSTDILLFLFFCLALGAAFIFGRALARFLITFAAAIFVMGFVDPSNYLAFLAQIGMPEAFLSELVALHLTCRPFAVWCCEIAGQLVS